MTTIEEIIMFISTFIGCVFADVFANVFIAPRYPNWFKKDDNGRFIDSYGLIDVIIKYFKKRKQKKAKQKKECKMQTETSFPT
jgi:hypothetical protein